MWLQAGGLADDVFFITLNNAIVVPLLTLIDIGHRIHQIKRWWYCMPQNLLKIHGQEELNKHFANYTFEIGEQYTYLINTSVFISFFVCMQPILPIIGCLGYVLFLNATVRNLSRHYRRPGFHLKSI